MFKGKFGKYAVLGVAAGALATFVTISTTARADNKEKDREISRLSAQNTAIDGTAILLPSGVDPGDAGVITIYSNTITIPPRDNTVYVTLSGNGLGFCDGIAVNCQVDGTNCLPGSAGTVLPTGWVVPLGDEFGSDGDFGLSGLNYTFCAPITKGSHTITLNAATEFGDCNTYIEALHVYVDSNRIAPGVDQCGTYANPNPIASPD
jgi:hypothetical protein